MKTKSMIAAGVLIASGVVVGSALAQTPSTTASSTAAQRLQNLKARQDAAVAAAKAQQNQIARPAPTPTPPTTTTPTATPTTTPTATPTTTPTTRPTGAGGAAGTGGAGGAANAGGAGGAGGAANTAPKLPVVLSLDIEELKKTRPERRKSEVQQLQARWGGELLRNDRAASELKQHAQRTAYLQRIRALASKANDAKTVQAVDVLITKEDIRNADAMNALRSGAPPAAAAAAGAAK